MIGSASITGSTMSGSLTYVSVNSSGTTECDFDVSISGTASARCPDCDFAFDLVTSVSADRSTRSCSPEAVFSLLETYTSATYRSVNPGLGFTAAAVDRYSGTSGPYYYRITNARYDELTVLRDVYRSGSGTAYSESDDIAFYDYNYIYYTAYGTPYSSSSSYQYNSASYSRGVLDWEIYQLSGGTSAVNYYDYCGTATYSTGGYTLSTTDYYGTDDLPCGGSFGYFDYVDVWTLPAYSGDTITFAVDAPTTNSADTFVWVNAPDSCGEIIASPYSPCASSPSTKCPSGQFTATQSGDQQIVITNAEPCRGSAATYSITVQKN